MFKFFRSVESIPEDSSSIINEVDEDDDDEMLEPDDEEDDDWVCPNCGMPYGDCVCD